MNKKISILRVLLCCLFIMTNLTITSYAISPALIPTLPVITVVQFPRTVQEMREMAHKNMEKLILEEAVYNEDSWRIYAIMERNVLPQIPLKYLHSFYNDGWHLDFYNMLDDFPQYNYASGLTTYTHKTLYFYKCGESTCFHEWGHYICYWHGFTTARLQDLYNTESDALGDLMSNYGHTNEREFFAEFFSLWMRNPSKRDLYQEKAPQMSWIMTNMVLGNQTIEDFKKWKDASLEREASLMFGEKCD